MRARKELYIERQRSQPAIDCRLFLNDDDKYTFDPFWGFPLTQGVDEWISIISFFYRTIDCQAILPDKLISMGFSVDFARFQYLA